MIVAWRVQPYFGVDFDLLRAAADVAYDEGQRHPVADAQRARDPAEREPDFPGASATVAPAGSGNAIDAPVAPRTPTSATLAAAGVCAPISVAPSELIESPCTPPWIALAAPA